MTISDLHKHMEALHKEIAELREVIVNGTDDEAESAMWKAEELECEARQVGAEIIAMDKQGLDWYNWKE